MKAILASALGALTLAFTPAALGATPADDSTATSQTGTYVTLGAMVIDVDDVKVETAGKPDGSGSLDNGFGLTVAAGMKFGRALRSELEFGLRRADFDKHKNKPASGDATAMSVMANGYLAGRAGAQGQIRPYIGMGLGGARIDGEMMSAGNTYEADETKAAYQFMAGLGFVLTPTVELRAGYRHFATFGSDPAQTHNWETGITIHF